MAIKGWVGFRIHQLLKLELCNVKDISLIAAPHKIKLAQNTIFSYLCQLKSSFNTILVLVWATPFAMSRAVILYYNLEFYSPI